MIPRPLSHPDAQPQADSVPGMRFNIYLARRRGRRRYVAFDVPWSDVHTRIAEWNAAHPEPRTVQMCHERA